MTCHLDVTYVLLVPCRVALCILPAVKPSFFRHRFFDNRFPSRVSKTPGFSICGTKYIVESTHVGFLKIFELAVGTSWYFGPSTMYTKFFENRSKVMFSAENSSKVMEKKSQHDFRGQT